MIAHAKKSTGYKQSQPKANMKLQSVKLDGLHGNLDLEVSFNNDISLLVGINGSGKTSVLNVIDWLLKPNLAKLATAEYRELRLNFRHNGVPYSLFALKTVKKIVLSIESTGAPLAPIEVNLVRRYTGDDDDFACEREYNSLVPDPHERPMWDLLKSFPSPTVITLDRTISAEADGTHFVQTLHNEAKTRHQSPLTHVQDVMSTKYADYRAKAIQHDNELKARILMSALQDPAETFRHGSVKPMTGDEIQRLEEKVIKYLSGSIKTEIVTKQVHQFFNLSRTFAQRRVFATEQTHMMDFVLFQYRQIEHLAKAFNDLEVKNAAAFKELGEYLSAVNIFFKDSGKVLYFDEGSGQLVFSFLASAKPAPRSISHLSSGEKQILILFSFLGFVAKTGSVFIIDEPELSLHPKWQYEFLRSLLQIRPADTQLLLATHSPDIVGAYKSACVILRKYDK